MNTVDCSILPQIPKYRFVRLLLLNVFSEFSVLCGSSCSEEKKMWLKNSHSCQSGGFQTQPSRAVLRKSLLSPEMKGENPRYFCRACSTHTQTGTSQISASFFLPDKQLLQTWPGTGTQRIVLVMLMPRFTRVGIFLSLLFRLFFTCLSDLQSLLAAAEQWHVGNTQNWLSTAVASPQGSARALTFLGSIFILTSIGLRISGILHIKGRYKFLLDS